MTFADIQNKQGQFVVASAKAASLAGAGAGVAKEAQEKGFKISLTDSAQKGAYPISSFTWMLVYDKMPKEKGTEILKFAKYIMGETAQAAAEKLNYAEVPKEIRAAVVKSLDKVKLD